ncbi:maleylpyruvate isomerase N-terminal domain-containing protein [Plantactinospora sp. WMMB782]|uniref:maleylpyruvate isomerase N-terminal domain-containing protein n=1 Tax=Plantactinospora sp. WMMB782 TaxID=3404121 RepID=UPI003B941B2B
MLRVRLLECLAADQARLRQVAATDLAADVPGCPDWTVADLVRHVAVTYLHKVECMRTGRIPSSWPPDVSAEEPLPLFDRACRALDAEFDGRDPAALAPTWYDPDQTVGFWLRRMAQETVIHRVDAELAIGRSVAEIPADLATDGIDEVLRLFLGYRSRRWPEDFAEVLPGSAVEILATAGPASWLVRLGPDGATVASDRAAALAATVPVASAGNATAGPASSATAGPASSATAGPSGNATAGPSGTATAGPAATVSASPDRMLLWLWRRHDDDAIAWSGDRAAVDRLRLALAPATR